MATKKPDKEEAAPAVAAKPTVTVVDPQLAELKAKLADAEGKLNKLGIGKGMEPRVRRRMAAGLTREQAVDAEIRQQAHDAALKKYGKDDSQEKRQAILEAGVMSAHSI